MANLCRESQRQKAKSKEDCKRRVLAVILLTIVIVTIFAACCELPTEVSREPIDVKYTEACSAIVTDYEYKYNAWKGEMQLVPNTRTVFYDENWSIQYRISYDNGKSETKWCDCTEAEYNRVKEAISDGK